MYSAISFPLSSKGKSPHGEIGKHKGLKILAFNYVLSSSLSEGTNRWKVAVNKKQFVYDNVYDMISCIRHEEKKGSSSARDLQNSRLKNYCYFFFYTHVLITIGNTHVFLKTQPMHLCDSLVYNRIQAIVDTYLCIEQQRKCSQYVQHFREPKDPTPNTARGIS